MVTILPPDSESDCHWNGLDETHRHYFGLIPIERSPVTLTLTWKATRRAVPELVGVYALDLLLLEKYGYAVRKGSKVRLRFQRVGERIEIAINGGGPALVVGGWSGPK